MDKKYNLLLTICLIIHCVLLVSTWFIKYDNLLFPTTVVLYMFALVTAYILIKEEIASKKKT